MSGRAVARAAGMNHQTCAVAVNRLERLGLLKRQGSGKIQLIRLNAKNLLIRDLLLPLLLLAPPAEKVALAAAADEFRGSFAPRYGIRLSPVILTVREASSRRRKGDPLMKNIMREGIDLGPAKLGDILK